MNPDQADNFPFGAYQDGFEKLLGDMQPASAPTSNTPAQGAQVYEKIMACTPGLPPYPQPTQPPPQVMALCTELGRVTTEINDLKRDFRGMYSNMGTLKGNLDILHDELGGEIKTLHRKVDSTLCKVDDKISHMDENLKTTMGSLKQDLNLTMGSLSQQLDMLCALMPQGQGSMGE